MKPIFYKGPSLLTRIAFFVLFALALWVLDTRTELLKPAHRYFMTLSKPLYELTSLPGRVADWGDTSLISRETLLAENSALRAENRVLQLKLQKMATLVAENARLTELLNSSHSLNEEQVLIARLIGISPDPLRQEMWLDKGTDAGAAAGTAVLDAYGVAGQVIEVSESSSRVMLITDARSAVPVQIVRNGIRLVAEGTGSQGELFLRHVAATTDIQVDDVLVSSGLDRHYPAHYPVAKVVSVEKDPSQAFLVVRVQPVAQLDRSRHFLLALQSSSTP